MEIVTEMLTKQKDWQKNPGRIKHKINDKRTKIMKPAEMRERKKG